MSEHATPPAGQTAPGDSASVTWREFGGAEPDLARAVAEQLQARPAYLATVDAGGRPRVHPVTPIVSDDHLFVFMEPTSPKGRDIRERKHYALHNGVPDSAGTGGECHLRGEAWPIDDPKRRDLAVTAAPYAPHDRYALFELGVSAVVGTSYDGEDTIRHRWPKP
jgi:hypothetical protein